MNEIQKLTTQQCLIMRTNIFIFNTVNLINYPQINTEPFEKVILMIGWNIYLGLISNLNVIMATK
jgi:hypothetical protein